MKKKILYLIILGFVSLIPSYVSGAGCVKNGSVSLSKLLGDTWNINFQGGRAFCIEPGEDLNTGTVCTVSGSADVANAAAYSADYSSCGLNSAVTEDIKYKNVQYPDAINGNVYFVLKDKGYSPEQIASAQSCVTNAVSAARTSIGNSTADYYILDCGEGNQKLMIGAAEIGCKETTAACPNGKMVESQPSATCYSTMGGITASAAYTSTSGNQANVHQTYGQDQNAAGTGAYCKMFCQEYAKVTLPGGLVTSIQLGSHFIWPTSKENQTNKFTENAYPLKFKGEKVCKLVLMPDKGNFPGNGCNQDPVATYKGLYSEIVPLGNTGDYAGTKYEQVRISKGTYFENSGYCGTPKTSIGTVGIAGCTFTKYKVSGTTQYYNSDNRYSYYTSKVDAINAAAEAAASACAAFKEVESNLSKPRTITEQKCKSWLGPVCIGGYETVTVDNPVYKDAENKQKAAATAAGAYTTATNLTTGIENSITNCQKYINKFNQARSILGEISLCGNFKIENASDYFNFNTSANFSFPNDEYGFSGSLQQENSTEYGCSGNCSGLSFKKFEEYKILTNLDTVSILDGKVSQIEARTITLETNEIVYKSTSNYSYINKTTNKYSTSKTNGNFLEILNINGGLAKIIPTDYNTSVIDDDGKANLFDLILSNVTFGEGLKFKLNGGSNYVCKYELSKKNDDCVCPQDTNMAGKDLMYYVANDPTSCADAQVKYCKSFEEKKYEDLYCPDPGNPILLTPCLKTGIGYAACVTKFCTTDEYRCKDEAGARTGMDMTGCVQTEMVQGATEEEAKAYCDYSVCKGKFIIYRTISLENPFPGKEISNIVSEFNDNVKGRYPGTNWNGVTLVNQKIRNNRGVSGSSIYQKTEPLYSFVLDGPKIEAIRKYNENKSYNDFLLDCTKNDSSACVSRFVHNPIYGLTSGECFSVDKTASSFYNCLGR